ncbi:MAG: tyrosine-type recombinase/integrase [Rickettsiales bacterium]
MKRINTRHIKSKLSYTVQELASVTHVHPNTVHRWIEEGLPRIDDAYPSPEQIRKTLSVLPANTDVQLRDRAVLAFLFTTGARDGALITLKLKHINTEKKYVKQNPKEVATKFGKHINTRFYPVGDDIHQVILDWVKHLREVLLFGDNDPLFPKEVLVQGEDMSFTGGTLSREHWKSASAVRRILKASFEMAGLPYFSPHRIRDTISAIGRTMCKTVEDQMAWARNMGHETPATTFIVYGGFSVAQQFEVIERMERDEEKQSSSLEASEVAKEVVRLLKQE